MKIKATELCGMKVIREVDSAVEVNRLLELGWVLLGATQGTGEDGVSYFYYCLGRGEKVSSDEDEGIRRGL